MNLTLPRAGKGSGGGLAGQGRGVPGAPPPSFGRRRAQRGTGRGAAELGQPVFEAQPGNAAQVACAPGSSLPVMSARGIQPERLRAARWPQLPRAGGLCGLVAGSCRAGRAFAPGVPATSARRPAPTQAPGHAPGFPAAVSPSYGAQRISRRRPGCGRCRPRAGWRCPSAPLCGACSQGAPG